MKLTKHAEKRMNQRGAKHDFVEELITNADIETPVGGGCLMLRVSPERANQCRHRDKIARFGVIMCGSTEQIITVAAVYKNHFGRRAA